MSEIDYSSKSILLFLQQQEKISSWFLILMMNLPVHKSRQGW
jgi:hypothetical protein